MIGNIPNLEIGIKLFIAVLLSTGVYKIINSIIERNIVQKTFKSMYSQAETSSRKRKELAERLRLEDGRKEKVALLEKLDGLIMQSNIKALIPFLNTEIFIILTLLIAIGVFIGINALTKTFILAVAGFFGTILGIYLLLSFFSALSYKKTEKNIMTFINLMENYSRTTTDIITIFENVYPYLENPLRLAIEECCSDARNTGNVSLALEKLQNKIEYEKFKDVIRNIEICSRYEANYSEIVGDIRQMLREHIAAAEEKRAMFNEGRIQIVIIIAATAVIANMLNDFVGKGILGILLSAPAGNVIIGYYIVVFMIIAIKLLAVRK